MGNKYTLEMIIKRNLERVAAGIWQLTDAWDDADTGFWGKSIQTDSMLVEVVQRGEDADLKMSLIPVRGGQGVHREADWWEMDTSEHWVQPFLWESPYTDNSSVENHFRHWMGRDPDKCEQLKSLAENNADVVADCSYRVQSNFYRMNEGYFSLTVAADNPPLDIGETLQTITTAIEQDGEKIVTKTDIRGSESGVLLVQYND